MPGPGQDPFFTIGVILMVMAVVGVIERVIPLHARARGNRARLVPNLALTFITFATNIVCNVALVAALAGLETRGFGLLPMLALPPWATALVVVLALDLSFWVAHVAMHKIPSLWRFHRVHHSDPAVDVTTTMRQHPGEGVIRYALLAAFAFPLGVGPGPFALYRVASALSGLFEHANIRVPARLDGWLSLIFTWPGVHKVHHSRDARSTDTNYGNLFCWWDRLGGTFTPAHFGTAVTYGLDHLDDAATQTMAGLLRLPFRPGQAASDAPTAALNPERC